MRELETQVERLKSEIIAIMNFEDMTPADIDAEAPLFGDGLGLDSIDALELVVLLDKQYGIKVTGPEQVRDAFTSVRALAQFILSNKAK